MLLHNRTNRLLRPRQTIRKHLAQHHRPARPPATRQNTPLLQLNHPPTLPYLKHPQLRIILTTLHALQHVLYRRNRHATPPRLVDDLRQTQIVIRV